MVAIDFQERMSLPLRPHGVALPKEERMITENVISEKRKESYRKPGAKFLFESSRQRLHVHYTRSYGPR